VNREKSIEVVPGLRTRNDRGAVVVIVAALLMVFFGFVAMALDVGYLYVVRNELQNAADAGALAGARDLYLNDGSAVNTGANQTAFDAATANDGMRLAVEVQDPYSNSGDVQRGHWSFATRTFTPNSSTTPVDLWDVSFASLDTNPNFINAVRVVTRRQAIPTRTFFAGVLGYDSVVMNAEAVAYIGYAGNTEWDQVDIPIALCSWAILDEGNGNYTCSRARMSSSDGTETTNTSGWTNFSQDPCETASTSSIDPYVGCPPEEAPGLIFGAPMGTTGGVVDNQFRDLRDCWFNDPSLDIATVDGIPDQSWFVKLPVIECPGKNVENCSTLVGVVEAEILWVKRDNDWEDAPLEMHSSAVDWVCSHGTSLGKKDDDLREECWNEFTSAFNLQDWNNTPVSEIPDNKLKKTIYFAPNCTPSEPGGRTGGLNYGVLAKIPVLVN